MPVKRLITLKQSQKLVNTKKYKGKNITAMTQYEKDDLLKIIAKKLGLL